MEVNWFKVPVFGNNIETVGGVVSNREENTLEHKKTEKLQMLCHILSLILTSGTSV